jgi:hypothetical protein
MHVNGVLMTVGHVSWKILEQCGDINTKLDYWLTFSAKILLTPSSLCPTIERQRSINYLRPSILQIQWAIWLQLSIIALLAAFLGKYALDKIITMSRNDCRRSINNVCASILDNVTGVEHRKTTMNLSAACIGNNTSDDNASASYNWAPTVRQGSARYTAINSIMLFYNGV